MSSSSSSLHKGLWYLSVVCLLAVPVAAYFLLEEPEFQGYLTRFQTASALIVRSPLFWIGVVLFFVSDLVAHSLLFHFASGAAVGVLAAFLLIILMVANRTSNKAAIGLAAGGGTVMALLFRQLELSFYSLIRNKVFILYTILAAVIGVIYVYKRPLDRKDQVILSWVLRAISFALVALAAQNYEVSATALATLLLLYYQPFDVFNGLYYDVWLRIRPKQKRMLTMEEYNDMCERTTSDEIQKLRQYCQDHSSWISKVKSTTLPSMQKFLEGGSHWQITNRELHYASAANSPRTPGSEHQFDFDSDNDNDDYDDGGSGSGSSD